MIETKIRQLPDGRWQLLQVHDDWDSLAASIEAMDLDADWGPEVRVETTARNQTTAEPVTCEPDPTPFTVGAKGKTRGGWPYEITRTDAAYITSPNVLQVIEARHTYPDGITDISNHCDDGCFWGDRRECEWDLLPPCEPWDGVFREGDMGPTRDGGAYIVEATDVEASCLGEPQPLRVHMTWPDGTTLRTHHSACGAFAPAAQSGFDLMPPTKRGPKV